MENNTEEKAPTIVFIGSTDRNKLAEKLVEELKESCKEGKGGEPLVIVSNNEAQTWRLRDEAKEKVIKWKEHENIQRYISQPENIQKAIEECWEINRLVNEYMHIQHFRETMEASELSGLAERDLLDKALAHEYTWDGWMTANDVEKATTMHLNEARMKLETLYAFGYVIREQVNYNRVMYRILKNDHEKLEYFEKKREDLKNDTKIMTKLINATKKRIEKAKSK